MEVDLHMHSTASDGALRPAELVGLAAQRGLKIIAITDHDSVDGIEEALEAAKRYPSLTVIPGVEINTDIPHGEVHILGYFVDYQDQGLREALVRLRSARELRAHKMIDKLNDMGLGVDWGRVEEFASGGSVGRPHIAQAMLERGHISSMQEAFEKYIGREGPAYAEREKLTPAEAVELVVRARGLPVLAHPADIDGLEGLVRQLKEVGLVGMEVYYDGYKSETIRGLLRMADRHGLIPSGGSDYHGLRDDRETLPGGVDVPLSSAQRLMALARQRSLEVTP
ncbi:MAG: PHP domain-containing protein [Chloroflexota bacterium]|nr:PHP domain-containing protein [Chloroflexota bacterium]